MKIKHLLCLLSTAIVLPVLGQQSSIKYEVETQAIGTTNDVVPFWMRSNQFGSIPTDGISGSFIGRAHKEYDSTTPRRFDWAAGFEGRANVGQNSKLILIEGYAKVKAGIFQLKGGRSKDVMGLNGDTSLTSGNFAVSGNSLGIPKFEIAIPDYFSLPFTDGLISIKGTFSHGWIGTTRGLDSIRGKAPYTYAFKTTTTTPTSYLHQKSFYGRIGKENWRLKLYGGFNHQVVWGGEAEAYGSKFKLNSAETFLYVITGKAYGNQEIPKSKIGNQLGSIDLGLQYDFDNIRILAYRQNFYDVGALAKLANIRDGLNGITVVNSNFEKSSNMNFQWKSILFEFLYTKNQAGETWSKRTKSGDEDYYNNWYYLDGWSYKKAGIGTPFISDKNSTRDDLVSAPNQFFNNNRVIAIHSGLEASIKRWDFMTKLSYSVNHGTFSTSETGSSIGDSFTPPVHGIFKKAKQLSAYFKTQTHLNGGYVVGGAIAIDQGQLLYNSTGVQVFLSKSF